MSSSPSPSPSPPKQNRLAAFQSVLNSDIIDIAQLKSLCFHGIPDDDGTVRTLQRLDSPSPGLAGAGTAGIRSLRPLCWKLLLNYLPPDRSKWSCVLDKKRKQYYDWSNEFLSHSNCTNSVLGAAPDPSSPEEQDHPLNLDPNSGWKTFFNDNEILLQIDKDVRRLYPEIHFFQSTTSHPHPSIINGTFTPLSSRVNSGSFIRSSNVVSKGLGIKRIIQQQTANNNCSGSGSGDNEDKISKSEYHWEVIERILFLYAKLNPGQGYVQGMNELIGPLYYILSTDPDPTSSPHAEPDTFHLFTSLMSQSRDCFIKQLDNSHGSGIKWKMTQVYGKLKSVDPELWEKLHSLKILPEYFCFRWLTLLLSQEFQLPDLLRVWDSLLSYTPIDTPGSTSATPAPLSPTSQSATASSDFLISMSISMLISIRKDLLTGDFASNIKLLQNFPTNINVEKLIEMAQSI